jgi:O-antigen/teichoic acid export membrane protein
MKSVKEIAITYAGSLGAGIALFAANALLGRALGAAEYGALSLALIAVSMIAELSDFGLNAGLIRFASYYHAHKEKEKLYALLHLVWGWRIRLAAAMTLGGALLAAPAARYILRAPDLAPLIVFSLIGVGGVVLLGFATTALQAMQRYRASAALQLAKGAVRLGAIAGLVYAGVTDLYALVAGFVAAPWILLAIAMPLLPPFLRTKPSAENTAALRKTVRSFSAWLAVWSFAAIVAGRIEQIALSALMGLEAVGLYTTAHQLLQFMVMGTQAISTVIAPKIAGARSRAELLALARTVNTRLIVLAAALAPALIATQYAIPLFFGIKYAAAMPLYAIMSVSYLAYVLVIPPSLIITAYRETRAFAVIGISQIAITIISNCLFIPRLGAAGAAWAFALGCAFVYAANTAVALRLISQRKEVTIS